ncbi:MAG: hypothetical protein ACLQGV_07955 [Bryobacteraceae bacterium]
MTKAALITLCSAVFLGAVFSFHSLGRCAGNDAPKTGPYEFGGVGALEYWPLLIRYEPRKAILVVVGSAKLLSIDGGRLNPITVDGSSPYPLLLDRLRANGVMGTRYLPGKKNKVWMQCDAVTLRNGYLLDPGTHSFEMGAQFLTAPGQITREIYNSVSNRTYSASLSAGRVYELATQIDAKVNPAASPGPRTWSALLKIRPLSGDPFKIPWEPVPILPQ